MAEIQNIFKTPEVSIKEKTDAMADKIRDFSRKVDKNISDDISYFIIKNSDENNLISADITGLDEDLDINTILSGESATSPLFSAIAGTIIDALDGNTKDGTIGNTKQGATGDCWLLSGVNALSYTEKGKEIIKNALEYTNNGVIVHLKGVGDYTVSNLDIAKTKASYQYSDGDDDMIAFELAIEDAKDDIAKVNFMFDDYFAKSNHMTSYDTIATRLGYSSTTGGTLKSAFYLIAGKEGTVFFDKNGMKYQIDEFQNNNGKDFALTAAIYSTPEDSKKTVTDIYGNTIKLADSHAYAIKKVDDNNVTFINPWDSSKEYTISREVFLDTFSQTTGCDLSDNNPEINLINKPLAIRDNGDKLFIGETNVKVFESEFDNEGVYKSGIQLVIYSKDGKYIDSIFSSFDDISANQEAFDDFLKNAFDNFNKNGSIWDKTIPEQ